MNTVSLNNTESNPNTASLNNTRSHPNTNVNMTETWTNWAPDDSRANT